ncbi:MAG: hypothetical protein NZM43_03940 [Saprospiraceae bacterium]|nr:hypothetical protein [Saprospiraceae bacterium]MDW8483457.1 hypothetical protein [Saprospiraceae bacterium]
MKRTSIFSVFSILLLLTLNISLDAQGIYFHDQQPCGVSADIPEGSQDLPEGYVPICTDPTRIRYIRVAVHFLLPGKIIKRELRDCDANSTTINYIGLGNFTESGDGFSNSGYNGYKRAEDIINQANAELDDNADQWRKANDSLVQNPPLNISYPPTPPEIKVRYLLTGMCLTMTILNMYSLLVGIGL